MLKARRLSTENAVNANRRFSRRKLIVFAVGLLLIGLVLFAWMNSTREHKINKSVTVSVGIVQTRDVPVLLRSIGTVTAVNSVAIKPHLNGQIMQVFFREGQPIAEGQPLFSIDPRPLQATVLQQRADVQSKAALVAQAQAAIGKDQAVLEQANANIEKDKAIAANAQVEANRYALLSRQGAVSLEQAEQYRTTATAAYATARADQAAATNAKALITADRANLLSAKAQLAGSQAQLQNAMVQLGYTQIRSPISGIAGNIQILKGNVVRQDTDVLVTINQIQPINVNLTIPEQQFTDLRRYAAAGPILGEVFDTQGHAIASGGRLIFENNTVEPTTGTVLLKITFPNSDNRLWPGQFVNTVLTLSVIPHAIVVPSQAVQTGLNGTFIWMIKPDNTVYMQPVTTGDTSGDVTLIKSGVRPGQKIIVDGQLQLAPGAHVKVSKMNL
jgi:multidrug efflux system membrane fusion protein